MAEPPEFWTYALTNFLMFGFEVTLTELSLFAYLADRSRISLRRATGRFGSLTVGSLVAPAYQLGMKGSTRWRETNYSSCSRSRANSSSPALERSFLHLSLQ